MIVRDLGDAWQIVLQTDHADLSAAFARAWATPLAPVARLATERHDDGWAVWEQSPRFDEDGTPVNFLDVDVRSHLAFYRAGIAAITEEDAYAGLLVSMHGAGIYRQRYGLDTALGLTRAAEVQGEVDAFVAEQEAKFGGDPGERQADYELLQLFDRLSLYFCMRDVVGGEAAELQGYRLEPVGPWRVQARRRTRSDSPPSSRCSAGRAEGWRLDVLAAAPPGDGDHDRATRGVGRRPDGGLVHPGSAGLSPHVSGSAAPDASVLQDRRRPARASRTATSSRSGSPTNRKRWPTRPSGCSGSRSA